MTSLTAFGLSQIQRGTWWFEPSEPWRGNTAARKRSDENRRGLLRILHAAGQPIRKLLGIGQHERMTDEQIQQLLDGVEKQFRADPVEFPAARLVRLEALLGKFGMTPADRSKVGGKKEAPKGNPFADL